MKLRSAFYAVALLLTIAVLAQTAEYTTDPVYVSFTGDAPTELLVTAPENLEVNKSRGFAKVPGQKVEIKGTVSDDDGIKSMMINRFAVNVAMDGSFAKEIPLVSGENTITFIVTDDNDNRFEKNYTLVSEAAQAVASESPTAVGDYYALLVGINEYDDPQIVDLDRPIQDAESLANILMEQYTFEPANVTLLKDATRADIIDALDNLRKRITPNDNLLLFYAGHGLWDAEGEIGYWIPSDGSKSSTAGYFRNSTLTDLIGAIKTKHTLLLADACFSGAIFKSRRAFFDADVAVNKLYELPSRKAMTSGTLTEVPDRSAFLEYMNKRLMSNSQKYMTASRLFTNIRETVINNSDVIPQYGTIQKVGDEGGEFIFIRRD